LAKQSECPNLRIRSPAGFSKWPLSDTDLSRVAERRRRRRKKKKTKKKKRKKADLRPERKKA
jgi:hypothetical protein